MLKHSDRTIEKSFTDFSLISEISEVTDLSFEDKDSSGNPNKQVRFNSDVNNNGFLNSSVISDASLIDFESKLLKLPVKVSDENNSNYMKNKFYTSFERNDKSKSDAVVTTKNQSNVSAKDDNINDDTSIWTSGTETSEDISFNSDRNNDKKSLFKTIDSLPSEFSNESSNSSDKILKEKLSENYNNQTIHSKYSKNNDEIDLSKPIVNSSGRLKREINNLEADLKYRKENVTDAAKEIASKQLSNQLNMEKKFHSVFETQAPIELTQPLNLKQNQELFPELTRLSIGDEAILAAQQMKTAAIRKRVGADKIKPKVKDGIPEPDLLEFFDPDKHIFKFRNLSVDYKPEKFDPSPSLIDKRLDTIFRDNEVFHQFR